MRSRKVGETREEGLSRSPVGSAEGTTVWPGVGGQDGVHISESGSRTGRLDGVPHSRGPCPAQQATRRTATKRTPRSMEDLPFYLWRQTVMEPNAFSEDDRETVHL